MDKLNHLDDFMVGFALPLDLEFEFLETFMKLLNDFCIVVGFLHSIFVNCDF
jgi:hypothetical protein